MPPAQHPVPHVAENEVSVRESVHPMAEDEVSVVLMAEDEVSVRESVYPMAEDEASVVL